LAFDNHGFLQLGGFEWGLGKKEERNSKKEIKKENKKKS